MTTTNQTPDTAAMVLGKLIVECQKKRMIVKLAEAMGIKRQTVYLWRDEEVLSERNARARLWEISQIESAELKIFKDMAVAALSAKTNIESDK
jgi:hypothetical protein